MFHFCCDDQGMSPQVEQRPPQLTRSKRRLQRRAGACDPCRASKLRCNGDRPCTSCVRRRDRPNCVYRTQGSRGRADRTQLKRSDAQTSSDSSRETSGEPFSDAHECDIENHSHGECSESLLNGVPYGSCSLARCVDLFESLADETQPSATTETIKRYTKIRSCEVIQEHGIEQLIDGASETSQRYPQAVPNLLIPDEVVQDMSPDLTAIYRATMNIRNLVQTGSLVSAWLDITRLVKVTELVCGTNQEHPNVLNALKSRDVELRRRISWLVFELEIRISTHFGQPVNISTRFLNGVGRPTMDGLDDSVRYLMISKFDFGRAVLDVLSLISGDMQGNTVFQSYDNLVQSVNCDRLEKIESRLPSMPSTLCDDTNYTIGIAIADHRIEFFAIKMLIACVLESAFRKKTPLPGPGTQTESDKLLHRPKQTKGHWKQEHNYQRNIIGSAIKISRDFVSLYQVQAAKDERNWPRCFTAYSAACILAVASLRQGRSAELYQPTINKVQATFCDISQRDQSWAFAKLASTHIAALSSMMTTSGSQTPPQDLRAQGLEAERSPTNDMHLRRTRKPPPSSAAQILRGKQGSNVTEASNASGPRRKERGPDPPSVEFHNRMNRPFHQNDPTNVPDQPMHQFATLPSQSDDLLSSSAYIGSYNPAGFTAVNSACQGNSHVGTITATGNVNEEYPYPSTWLGPPLSLPSLPMSHPERSRLTSHYNAWGESVGIGYDQYLRTELVGHDPTMYLMEGAGHPPNMTSLLAWNKQLQQFNHLDGANTHLLFGSHG